MASFDMPSAGMIIPSSVASFRTAAGAVSTLMRRGFFGLDSVCCFELSFEPGTVDFDSVALVLGGGTASLARFKLAMFLS